MKTGVNAVLEVGATSGADQLVGFLSLFKEKPTWLLGE